MRTDPRRHGGSSAPRAPYTIDMLAYDVVELLDETRIERIHFVGWSTGGRIGQSHGLRHHSRLHSLLLSGTQSQSPMDAAAFWDLMIAAIDMAGSLEPIADKTTERSFTAAYQSA
ncbi:hypothetical protein CIC12_21705 [Burkholderia sp. SG-MS1]|uniref:alpha/beta fold hydrolase n=1 Tax=Paraburkholderia sp. SG-MS1 TaxID=2023741 RepID=UPI001447607F|nr:alpha/beta fold hydrolase [Paraburkholderia sp. SG-MS1]NKJ49298.1 hypothetical protein [Paraburkholderia sp. SG-MS1]